MTETSHQPNLPAQITDALTGIPKGLIPTSLKALDRLIGAAVDIPVAWLTQKKARIDAQTQAYSLVEEAIANAAAGRAIADEETVRAAVSVLVRKSYRKQVNREAVAVAAMEDLRTSNVSEEPKEAAEPPPPPLDEDWLNVFERYAEDASTERMQNLWGRVLAGEIRKPGRYAMRTLRFLFEFSQADALTFAEFCTSAFGDTAPSALVKPEEKKDIRDLIFLESSGLIQGGSGMGLSLSLTFDQHGRAYMREGSLILMLQGEPKQSFQFSCCVLTPLGQELLSLLPSRDARTAARKVGHAIKRPEIKSAFLSTLAPNNQIIPMEVLWQSGTGHVVSSVL